MDLQEEINWIKSELDKSPDPDLVLTIKRMLNWRKAKGYRISVAEYNSQLKEAEIEYERGEYITHEDLSKDSEAF